MRGFLIEFLKLLLAVGFAFGASLSVYSPVCRTVCLVGSAVVILVATDAKMGVWVVEVD